MRSLVIEKKQGDKTLLMRGVFFENEKDYANYQTKKKIRTASTVVKVASAICTVLIIAQLIKK